MTADEMFEDLGYDKIVKKPNEIEYSMVYVDMTFTIIFNLKLETYMHYLYINSLNKSNLLHVDVKTHKAITKKMEELGWL